MKIHIDFFNRILKKIRCPIYGAIQNLPIYWLPIYSENPYMTHIYMSCMAPIYDFFLGIVGGSKGNRSVVILTTFVIKHFVWLIYDKVKLI